MRKSVLLAATLVCWPVVASSQPAPAPPTDDATAFVTGIIDKFNAGDTKAFVAAHDDNALIVDDFGRHVWTGPGTAQH